MMRIAALILAAGEGSRMKNSTNHPKQYLPVLGKSVLRRSIEAFLYASDSANIAIEIAAVINPEHYDYYQDAVNGLKLRPHVVGGKTRRESCYNGLRSLEDLQPDYVLIHDAARPFIKKEKIIEIISQLSHFDAVDMALPLRDSVKIYDKNNIVRPIARDKVFCSQTPQGFRYSKILEAHTKILDDDTMYYDDIEVFMSNSSDNTDNIGQVIGDSSNYKITTVEDYKMANHQAQRVGFGYDIHRFNIKSSGPITLCGVTIDHAFGIEAHSDGDVALHAVVDAILGALALGDIGQHFPPSDQRWKNADSRIFVQHALKLIQERGWIIGNVDITIICEKPKIAPYTLLMRNTLANLLEIDAEAVSIKATTNEGLGAIGKQEGIAVHAVCTVINADCFSRN